MSPGPYSRHWAVAEQRRQELLSEVDMIWQIRNAHADDPKPVAAPSSLSRLFGSALSRTMRATEGPIQFGPRPFHGDISKSIE